MESGPTTRARIFAKLNGARAMGATDALVAAVVQPVVGQIMQPEILPGLGEGPIQEWIYFDQSKVSVPFEFFCAGAGGSLIAANAGDPGIQFRCFRS